MPKSHSQSHFKKRIPLGESIVVGDSQEKGVPNPEIVHVTKKGASITPLKRGKMPKGMKKCAFGAGPTWTGDLNAIAAAQSGAKPMGIPAYEQAEASDGSTMMRRQRTSVFDRSRGFAAS